MNLNFFRQKHWNIGKDKVGRSVVTVFI